MASRRDVRSAVIGMVLGDGHLEKPVGPRGHSRFSSASILEEYARYKANVLSDLTGVRTWHDGQIWRIRTERHPLFTDLRRRFYIEGRKTVDAHLIRSLDVHGLMLWYFDDGDLHRTEQKVNIATQNFSEPECQVLVSGLYEQFGLRWNIQHCWRRDRKLCTLRLKGSDRQRFFSLIADAAQAIPSMAYKLLTAEGAEHIRTSSRLSRTDVDGKLPAQELLDLYATECLSIYEIAKRSGTNSGTVLGRLRKLGVAIRNAGKYAPRRYDLTPEATQGGTGNECPPAEVSLVATT